MAVFKRSGSPFYQYDFTFEGRRYWGSTKHRNKESAKRHENILREKLANSRSGIVERKPVPVFRVFAKDFLQRVKLELRPKSYTRYRDSLGLVTKDDKDTEREGALMSWFGCKRIDEITADEIERFKQSRMEEGLSPCTVNRDLACLRRILLFAVKLDALATTPFVAHKVRFLRENRRERILNFEEERHYLAAAMQPLRDVATLILEMGLRPEEACSIRCEDVHFYASTPFLHVPFGKTKNAVRDVPLTAKAKDVLTARVSKARGDYIFPLRRGKASATNPLKDGLDWTRPMVELHPAHYAALGKSNIVARFQVYDLRHTYGTRAIEGGTDPLTLMRLMGHADLKTTSRYVHLSKRHLADAQKRIEEYRAAREIAEAEARHQTEAVQ